jgi:hypothetical protein
MREHPKDGPLLVVPGGLAVDFVYVTLNGDTCTRYFVDISLNGDVPMPLESYVLCITLHGYACTVLNGNISRATFDSHGPALSNDGVDISLNRYRVGGYYHLATEIRDSNVLCSHQCLQTVYALHQSSGYVKEDVRALLDGLKNLSLCIRALHLISSG